MTCHMKMNISEHFTSYRLCMYGYTIGPKMKAILTGANSIFPPVKHFIKFKY